MTDDLINLLPDELRNQDQLELDAPIKKSAPVSYSQIDESKDLLKDFDKLNEEKYKTNSVFPAAEKELLNNQVQDKINPLNQIKTEVSAPKIKPVQTTKDESLTINQPVAASKNSPKANITTTKKSPWSWLAFWLKLFSIKPKSSTLDNASIRTDGNFSFDVNLVPRSAYNLPSNILWLKLALIAMIVIFLVSVIHWLFVLFSQNIIQKVIALQTVLDGNQASMQGYKDLTQQLNQLEVQSRSIDSLISRHIYWTQFLTKLESLTLPTIYYANMSANPNGRISLQVVAPSYTEAVQQLLFWQNRAEIKTMEFSGLAGNPASGEVNLSVKLEVDPVIFYKN